MFGFGGMDMAMGAGMQMNGMMDMADGMMLTQMGMPGLGAMQMGIGAMEMGMGQGMMNMGMMEMGMGYGGYGMGYGMGGIGGIGLMGGCMGLGCTLACCTAGLFSTGCIGYGCTLSCCRAGGLLSRCLGIGCRGPCCSRGIGRGLLSRCLGIGCNLACCTKTTVIVRNGNQNAQYPQYTNQKPQNYQNQYNQPQQYQVQYQKPQQHQQQTQQQYVQQPQQARQQRVQQYPQQPEQQPKQYQESLQQTQVQQNSQQYKGQTNQTQINNNIGVYRNQPQIYQGKPVYQKAKTPMQPIRQQQNDQRLVQFKAFSDNESQFYQQDDISIQQKQRQQPHNESLIYQGHLFHNINSNWKSVQQSILTYTHFMNYSLNTLTKIKIKSQVVYQGSLFLKLTFNHTNDQVYGSYKNQQLDWFFNIIYAKITTLLHKRIDQFAPFNNSIQGNILRKSQFLGNWQQRHVKIDKTGLKSYKQLNSYGNPSVTIPRIQQLWTRFQFIEEGTYMVIKCMVNQVKYQYGLPIDYFFSWLRAFYSLMSF